MLNNDLSPATTGHLAPPARDRAAQHHHAARPPPHRWPPRSSRSPRRRWLPRPQTWGVSGEADDPRPATESSDPAVTPPHTAACSAFRSSAVVPC
jgi:hypothetical protein